MIILNLSSYSSSEGVTPLLTLFGLIVPRNLLTCLFTFYWRVESIYFYSNCFTLFFF